MKREGENTMNKYQGTQTEKNLQAAFAGESQARNKYTYFSSVAKKDFSTGICLFAMVTVYTKVFGIIKGTFVIPVGQPMCFHLFGDGSGILTEEACDILKRSTFGKLILDVNTIIQS